MESLYCRNTDIRQKEFVSDPFCCFLFFLLLSVGGEGQRERGQRPQWTIHLTTIGAHF